jgi:hypothetical protein
MRSALLLFLFLGCGGAGEPAMKYSALDGQLFKKSCASSGCHAPGDDPAAGGLDLSGDAYDALVGVMPHNPAALARGWVRVEPGDPESSYLYQKLILKYPGASPAQQGLSPRKSGECTELCDRMPAGLAQPPLPADQIEAVRAWIAAGAPRN